jgi:calcium-independent phospholipase A2-gamma
VRATSAATTVFEPFSHGAQGQEIRYIDAGFGYNNPSDLVLEEAKSLWEDDEGFLNLNVDIGVFLSLGTGMGKVVRMSPDTTAQKLSAKAGKPLKAVDNMEKIVTGTERTHRGMAADFGRNSVRYHRFNVDHGLEETKLFDHMKREQMETDTQAYLEKWEVKEQVRKCVNVMKVLPVREPGLLDNRHDEANVYSLGSNGERDDRKLQQRFEALKM